MTDNDKDAAKADVADDFNRFCNSVSTGVDVNLGLEDRSTRNDVESATLEAGDFAATEAIQAEVVIDKISDQDEHIQQEVTEENGPTDSMANSKSTGLENSVVGGHENETSANAANNATIKNSGPETNDVENEQIPPLTVCPFCDIDLVSSVRIFRDLFCWLLLLNGMYYVTSSSQFSTNGFILCHLDAIRIGRKQHTPALLAGAF